MKTVEPFVIQTTSGEQIYFRPISGLLWKYEDPYDAFNFTAKGAVILRRIPLECFPDFYEYLNASKFHDGLTEIVSGLSPSDDWATNQFNMGLIKELADAAETVSFTLKSIKDRDDWESKLLPLAMGVPNETP